MDHDSLTLAALSPLCEVGFALHWLKPRQKAPLESEWSTKPRYTEAHLRATHRPRYNLGARLGEPSHLTDGSYLHVLDLDIRVAALADEAWARVKELFPNVCFTRLPIVISGSGGESRHVYFTSDEPFASKKLAHSESKFRGPDNRWHWEWEIELFGTGKQVAMPPSIHPDTRKPYVWQREFDALELLIDSPYDIPSAEIAAHQVSQNETFEFESREPLTFKAGQLEAYLRDIPENRLFDYTDWVNLGMALHHQFGGAEEGFKTWLEQSQRSKDAFKGKQTIREMRQKWRGFGRARGKPTTMATVIEWVKEERAAQIVGSFDEQDVDEDGPAVDSEDAAVDSEDADDFIGSPTTKTVESDDTDVAEADEEDDIDAALSEAAKPVDPSWASLLEINEEGAIKPTVHNLELLVRHDPRTTGLPQRNLFTNEVVQLREPGNRAPRRKKQPKPVRQLEGVTWAVRDTTNGDLWTDSKDYELRIAFEAPKSQGGYSIKISDRDIRASIDTVANRNAFHPVRNYLNAFKWDGESRVEDLFIDYMGAEDCSYSRDIARLMMVAAVTRIFEPGHKFDFAVILEGLQGKRKSTFIKVLAKHWGGDLDGDFHDTKQMVELMQGAWIMEIPELTGMARADVRAIKAFMSRTDDKARLAYAHRAAVYLRQCIFIGSTNDREYLKDDTGGRRFWPVECTVKEIDIDRLLDEVDQLWAESVALYRQMRKIQPHGTLPLYLANAESSTKAQQIQESRRIETAEDGIAGQIAAWLERPVYRDGLDGTKVAERRVSTCLREIWYEVLDGDFKQYGQQQASMLSRAMKLIPGWVSDGEKADVPKYGRQRVYVRRQAD